MNQSEQYSNYLFHAKEIALKAGLLVLDAFKKPKNIEYKHDVDLVTETDKQTELMIFEYIKSIFPDHLLLGEESVSSGEQVEEITEKPTWIIDPIDGTTNFVHKLPFSCISIGLSIENEIVMGVVYNPMMNEMFTAIKGEGAYFNGEKMQVSNTDELKKSLVATGFPYARDDETLSKVFYNINNILKNCRGIRRLGSAAIDMCYVAKGILDIYYERGVHAWDISAGYLIVKESGGVVTNFSGSKINICQGEVVCGNKQLVDKVIKLLK